jgi:hypothetical protein
MNSKFDLDMNTDFQEIKMNFFDQFHPKKA